MSKSPPEKRRTTSTSVSTASRAAASASSSENSREIDSLEGSSESEIDSSVLEAAEAELSQSSTESSSESDAADLDIDPQAVDQVATDPNAPYTAVDVTTALMKVADSGQFVDETLTEYETIMGELQAAAAELEGSPPTDMDVRVQMMTRRVEAAEAHRQQTQDLLGEHQNVMGIFIAPEWALGKNLTDTEFKEYRARFKALSAQYEHILMAPGSAVWQERRRKNSLLSKHENVMHNSAEVFFQGEKVHTQNKVNLAGDSAGDMVNRFDDDAPVTKERADKWLSKADERGGPGDSAFEAGGINFSMDICADHGSGVARDQVLAPTLGEDGELASSPTGSDVHLLVSTGMTLQNGSTPVRQGGLGVQADGKYGVGQVSTTTNEMPNTATQMIGASKMDGVVKPEFGKVFGEYNPDNLPNDRFHRRGLAPASTGALQGEDASEHRGHHIL